MAFCRYRARAERASCACPAFTGWAPERDYFDMVVPACTGFPTPPVMVWRPEDMAAVAIERLRERRLHGSVIATRILIPYRLVPSRPA